MPGKPSSSHGNVNRGLAAGANPEVGYGRYGRMFDAAAAKNLELDALRAIAKAMIKPDDGKPITESEGVDENPTIPAGYTYFGQFVDHDITLDPTPLGAAESDQDALVDFRSPALDLDCVYGRGPDDQPYMYERPDRNNPFKGLMLRVGDATTAGDAITGTRNDLFRLCDKTPILGDKRNDENKIVSQFHGAMIRLHNKVVRDTDLLTSFLGYTPADGAERFRAAAKIVRWHYQWVVVYDFLETICEPGMVAQVMNTGGTPQLMHYLKGDAKYPYMPIEFAGAAFRFGHSMVRPSYSLNTTILAPHDADSTKVRIPTFSGNQEASQNLNGFPGKLPSDWGIDFGFFLKMPVGPQAAAGNMQVPQLSYRIDALLAGPLSDLPEFFRETDTPEKKNSLVGNLAYRNLLRGQMLGLPSGQTVSRLLGIEPLSDEILWSAGSRRLADKPPPGDDSAKDLRETNERRGKVKEAWVDGNGGPLKGNTPLWHYILREAEWYGVTNNPDEDYVGFGGQHLGPVGSRIVAETLIGLLWADQGSFLHDTRGFRPMSLISNGNPLTLAGLIGYALSPSTSDTVPKPGAG